MATVHEGAEKYLLRTCEYAMIDGISLTSADRKLARAIAKRSGNGQF